MRLEPLSREHHDGLVAAASDGRLWELWYTSVPEPEQAHAYISGALAGLEAGHMLPWAVRELSTGEVAGCTRYHDILANVDRVEIGWTWYAKRWQKSHVNTACKLLLLGHGFEALGCKVVGLRTDVVPMPVTKHEHRMWFSSDPATRTTARDVMSDNSAVHIGATLTPEGVAQAAHRGRDPRGLRAAAAV